MRCYYCGKRISGDRTRDHFVPKSVVTALDLTQEFRGVNILPACRSCNQRKTNNILFPPFRPDTWWQLENVQQLPELQKAFEKLAKIVIDTPSTTYKSDYWSMWLHDKEMFYVKDNHESIFNKVKVVIQLDYITLAIDYRRCNNA